MNKNISTINISLANKDVILKSDHKVNQANRVHFITRPSKALISIKTGEAAHYWCHRFKKTHSSSLTYSFELSRQVSSRFIKNINLLKKALLSGRIYE